jgi:hypothetical protein
MGVDEAGVFVADATERGLTPEQYASELIEIHGNPTKASIKTGYTRNVFIYWRGGKEKQVKRQRERRRSKK